MKTKPKHAAPTMPLKQAVEIARRKRDLLFAPGSVDYNAQTRLIDYATTTDKDFANVILILMGLVCAPLALVLLIVGVIYVPTGNLQASAQVFPYFVTAAAIAVCGLWGVRR